MPSECQPLDCTRDSPADHARALLNILDDSAAERQRLRDTQSAVLNIAEDAAAERDRLLTTQKAVLNILEDSSSERERTAEMQHAALNILEDIADEKARLEEMKSAVLNILEDLAVEKDQLEESRREVSRSEQAIRQMNEGLERRVEERTAQLREANRELEAFSYSVSHDLRAPLRTVEGFAKILLRDYIGGVLDEKASFYMNRMSLASQRMGCLIDDLLTLSRISRQDLNRQRINLSEIAAAVLAELAGRDPQRAVSVSVEPGLWAEADARLLTVVLDNLFGNAWKFTGETGQPAISFGALREGAAPVYFVRDNGAGFDMAYSDQLFVPFQRLHGPEEFEGSGIGLATVQRIIRRHGGRVWGEGKPGNGATFYFTLEAEDGEKAHSAGGGSTRR